MINSAGNQIMKLLLNRATAQRGFNTLELLMVIVVIGILASVAFPRFLGARDRGHIGAAQSDVTLIRQALAFYAADHDRYPEAAASLEDLDNLMVDPQGNDYLVLPSGATFRWVSYDVLEDGDYLLKIQALDNNGTIICATGAGMVIQS